MEQLLEFFKQYGLELTLIAIAGIILLGILKYGEVFKKIEEKYRHLIYLGISVSFSVICSAIYLACTHQLTVSYLFIIAGAIYVLNQAAYSLFKTLSITELFKKFIEKIKEFLNRTPVA